MKKVLPFAMTGLFMLLLNGCATWPSDPRYVDVVDHQKISLVERWARTNRAQVIWVTTPTRKVPASGT